MSLFKKNHFLTIQIFNERWCGCKFKTAIYSIENASKSLIKWKYNWCMKVSSKLYNKCSADMQLQLWLISYVNEFLHNV